MRITAVTTAIVVIIVSLANAAGWPTFQAHGIEFLIPPDAQGSRLGPEVVRIDLPFASGTTLQEKYLLIGPAASGGDLAGGIEMGGAQLWFERGSEGAAGSLYDYVRCVATLKNGRRIALTFVLHSVNPGMFDSPPPPFDRTKETLAFWRIIASLRSSL